MQDGSKQRWLVGLMAIVIVLAVIGGGKWREETKRGGQSPADPFRIAGNFYYVGASDAASFLLTSPQGHVLIDGGTQGTPPLIMASIARLGFDIRDVKVLIATHSRSEHAGGLAALQDSSGAALWVSEGDADVVAAGGAGDESMGPFKVLTHVPLFQYPAPRVDHRFRDGDTIRLGPIALVARITPGHTPGCASWSFPVQDGERVLNVVHICSLEVPPAMRMGERPDIRADLERSFRTLRALPVDIWVTTHARHFGRYRKFRQRDSVADPVAPFIDRAGYFAFIDSAETALRELLAEQQQNQARRN